MDLLDLATPPDRWRVTSWADMNDAGLPNFVNLAPDATQRQQRQPLGVSSDMHNPAEPPSLVDCFAVALQMRRPADATD
jgi:hypothetical protein